MYTLVLGGDEEGLYLNGKLVASSWSLRKIGHDVVSMVNYSQGFLKKIHQAVELYFSR